MIDVVEANSKEGLAGKRVVKLLPLARAQRNVLVAIAMYFGLIALLAAGSAIRQSLGPQTMSGELVRYVLIAVSGGTMLLALLRVWQLGRRLGLSVQTSTMLLILVPVPAIGLFVVFMLLKTSTDALRLAGCKVGLFGVPAAEMHRLIRGACMGCGYDLSGLETRTCPECGRAFDPLMQ